MLRSSIIISNIVVARKMSDSNAPLEKISGLLDESSSLLKEQELEAAYREANQEIDSAWDATSGDGLEEDSW